jgi:hypothetical protein
MTEPDELNDGTEYKLVDDLDNQILSSKLQKRPVTKSDSESNFNFKKKQLKE